MEPFTRVSGRAIPLLLPNIDTDIIIRVERMTSVDAAVLAPWAFEALRYRPDGSVVPDFVLNDDRYRQAPILLAGENFGCGSSREPAVWAIQGLGVRCIVAPSFGDIFFSNCFTNGLLCVLLDAAAVGVLAQCAADGREISVDLPAQRVSAPDGSWTFNVGSMQKSMLLEGMDEMELALRRLSETDKWEGTDRVTRPWAWAGSHGDSN
jgi:3-isopropylmalate/(R)-2-methylmalate dehydratase small subunit